MKTLKLLSVLFIFCLALTTTAQTAEEIIDTYIENIGGVDAWNKVESVKITGVGKQGGQDYPFVATFMNDGRSNITIELPGTSMVYQAFDGETAWGMNFQTQKAEALDSETSLNMKNEAKDNVEIFLNYKEKGYSVELLEKTTWEGTEVNKIKLTKTPMMVDGKEEENTEIYYFDTENNVPIASEAVVKSGPAKGATAQTIMTDYQEVGGLYLAHTIIEKFNGQTGLEMIYETVEFNTEIDEAIFKMPKE
ncbi:outer membrane lipoprotein-sorting protein [uncultured Winogradskyella sp.]|uniref:outer membrane lipoprotein-sorting protein n=1 Tax=uncultured Winogradskyella sp. TaxID=395353 RepID=UPI002621833A|nr:outer membrane lipoprotein-sorting protein [uncultured Winogradskyella sp.]